MAGHSSIASDVWNRVQRRLDDMERRYGITILHAVESGSRAWGFSSPDSDFDVRFIYRHPTSWYVSIFEERDVVEEGVDDLGMDVSGWDVRKTLRLLLKSNPVLYEWLTSPIVYRSSQDWAARARALCESVFDRAALGRHYRSIALNHRKAYWQGNEAIILKKYFYVIRPICAIAWLRSNPRAIPPMNLQALMAEIDLPYAVRIAIDQLLECKQRTKELGTAAPIPELESWIEKELAKGAAICENDPPMETERRQVDGFYRDSIGLTASALGQSA